MHSNYRPNNHNNNVANAGKASSGDLLYSTENQRKPLPQAKCNFARSTVYGKGHSASGACGVVAYQPIRYEQSNHAALQPHFYEVLLDQHNSQPVKMGLMREQPMPRQQQYGAKQVQQQQRHAPPPVHNYPYVTRTIELQPRNAGTLHNNNNNNNIIGIHMNGGHISDADDDDDNAGNLLYLERRQQPSKPSERQRLLPSPETSAYQKDCSSDQHYQHYFAYYYDRQPARATKPFEQHQQQQRSKGRKLPDTHMASARKQQLKDVEARNKAPAGTQSEKGRSHQGDGETTTATQLGLETHVLKEKQPNNNLLSCHHHQHHHYNRHQQQQVHYDRDWMSMPTAAYENVLSDIGLYMKEPFYDGEPDDFADGPMMNFLLTDDGKTTQELLGGKPHVGKKAFGGETNQMPQKMVNNAKGDTESWAIHDRARPHHPDKAGKDESEDLGKSTDKVIATHRDGDDALDRQGRKKLPITPHKIKATGGKKHSPSPHKVLHYGSQSPRLQRLSPSLTVSRANCSKSPLKPTRHKTQAIGQRTTANQGNRVSEKPTDEKATDALDCYTRVMKSLSSVGSGEKQNGSQRQGTDGSSSPRQRGGGDNNSDINNNSDNDDDYDDDDDLDNVSGGADDSSDASDDTSNSEDGYRAFAFKMTYSVDRASLNTNSYLSSEPSEDNVAVPDCVLVPSLFPNVPPYLAFSSNLRRGPQVPQELYRVLKWRVTNVMPKVVRCILANSGMRLLKKTNDWMGIWGKHMKSPCFKTIRPYQKINHLPGSFKIGRKDSCWKNLLKQINRHGKKEFGFMPKTYIIPHDLNLLRKHWPKYAQRNVKWIIKPPASARGTGIRVVDRWAQIPKRRPLIVQKYIERPLLINGSKFDLRLYVLVTSINPLRVYMYHNGLARFASVKYSGRSDTLNDRCMHLTNYSINKFSSNYSKNEDVNACHGHKWTIKSLLSYLANRGVRTDCLWEALRNLVLRTIIAGEQSINNMIRGNVESKYSCFELFGFDVLLDAELIPWLLEVNISPSLHSELPLDAHVKAPLVQGVLNTALFNVPPKLSNEAQKQIATELSLPPDMPLCYDKRLYINFLSRADKIKHATFTRKTLEDREEYISAILDNLTPDDIRCLIVAEDELSRCAPLERIFPTNQSHKYLKYIECPRYYNRLLDAWETRYAGNRQKGIALLRQFCEEKYHLEVPPSPAKKPLTCRPRTLVRMRQMALRTTRTVATLTTRRCSGRRTFIYKTMRRHSPTAGQQNVGETTTKITSPTDEHWTEDNKRLNENIPSIPSSSSSSLSSNSLN